MKIEKKMKYACVAKTLKGLEEPLMQELQALGFEKLFMRRRAVEFEADIEGIYRANLELRNALSVLVNIAVFNFKNDKDIYNEALRIDWGSIFNMRKTFAIQHSVFGDVFKNSMYPALVLKDAIADRFRSKYKARPNIDKERPDVIIDLYIYDNRCIISLNSSGFPLYRRAYRGVMTFPAPLNEVLASGMVDLSGWDGKTDFINPMCGSGTLVVEAAIKAYGIQPGYLRDEFAFMNWEIFDADLFQSLRRDPEKSLNANGPKIYGSDISRRAISITNHALNLYGLGEKVSLERMDFLKPKVRSKGGVIIINPPYGERLEVENIDEYYKSIGDSLRAFYKGHKAWILTSNIEALDHIGMDVSNGYDLLNGDLFCKFVCYDMYSPNTVKKTKKSEPS